MSSLDELKARARKLHSEGRSTSQIADEMSLSGETITWLLTQQAGSEKTESVPKDIVIDWSSISSYADMMHDAAVMMVKRYIHTLEASGKDPEEELPDLIVGVAHAGIPLAAIIADEYSCMFSMYHPKKHSTGDNAKGSLNSSFADVAGKRCLIVDDVITSGNTLKEAVAAVEKHGGIPVGISVLFDKLGVKEIGSVPVYPLIRLGRID